MTLFRTGYLSLTLAEATFSLAALENESGAVRQGRGPTLARHSTCRRYPKSAASRRLPRVASARPSALDSAPAAPRPSRLLPLRQQQLRRRCPPPRPHRTRRSGCYPRDSALRRGSAIYHQADRAHESETEYGVTLVKHVFQVERRVPVQCVNTIPDTVSSRSQC